jgi:cytosine/adenosine deaminase-related metal-dependent hydrolase
MAYVLRRGVVAGEGAREVVVDGACVGARTSRRAPSVDLAGRQVLPGLVNGHDHLGFASFPPLGRPPYASLYDWADDVRAGAGDARARDALAPAAADRLLLGGLRNLLAGVTAVVHHDAWHAALSRTGAGAWLSSLATRRRHGVRLRGGFPVRVLRRYAHAHSPGLERDLSGTRPRSPRVPWMLHAAEGTDTRAAAEIAALAAAGLLRPNTVLVHAVAASDEDAAALASSGAAVVWCPESNRHLYGATAPVARLRAAGVRLALGSDSSLSGVRDALSNLAAARRAGLFDDAALLRLATRDTAAVFGLPVGGFEPGAPADFVVVDDVERLLRGDRRAVQLVIVAGRARYGVPELMEALDASARRLTVDGDERSLDAGLATLLEHLLAAHPMLAHVPWLAGVRCAACRMRR